MHLTRYTDHALRVLIYLALTRDRRVTIDAIAGHYGISRNHVAKVVRELGQLGYIRTIPGKNGGVHLALPPKAINLGTLIRQTEKNRELVECFGNSNRCRITPACVLADGLSRALDTFLDVLDRHSLVDVLPEEPP
ncbi:MAG: Rrf2 family transcriptional regulator [Arhodomonas sp.]|nr:Rrf2 family transcriptional regulator [Arhodomonas sp.]